MPHYQNICGVRKKVTPPSNIVLRSRQPKDERKWEGKASLIKIADNEVYCFYKGSISVYSFEGELLRKWNSSFQSIESLLVNKDTLYLISGQAKIIEVYSTQGKLQNVLDFPEDKEEDEEEEYDLSRVCATLSDDILILMQYRDKYDYATFSLMTSDGKWLFDYRKYMDRRPNHMAVTSKEGKIFLQSLVE